MSMTGIGDAAQFMRLRRDGDSLQRDLSRLTSELSTGRVADLGRATGGDFSALAAVARDLRLSTAFAQTIAQAGMQAEARQAALARVEVEVSGSAPRLLAMAAGGSLSDLTLTLADMPARLDQAVLALNTSLAGVSLFAGDAPDQPALIPGDQMLDALRPIAATATTVPDLVAAVEDWFQDAGGGFDTVAWQGGAGEPAPVVLGEGRTEDAAVTARDPAIRSALAGLALAALAAEGLGPPAEADRRALAEAAAMRLLEGETALITLRAQLGQSEGRIETARAEVEATRLSLEIEQSRLTGADPYRTATDLESVQARLESHYVLTARLSRLSLTEFLR